jgi:MHS family proline/betaine transporter-like MFS transporter
MQKSKRIFLSAVSGNVLEYYDFTVYSVFAISIAHQFFPKTSEFSQILLSLGVFAVGFATRPLGGIVFGYIGDTFGRRAALLCSMLGMTIPTFTIGLTPSYEQIGIFAPIILVLLRLIQGLCISGEGAGAAIFLLEHEFKFKPGFLTSLTHSANIAGTILASIVGIVIEKYFSHIEDSWRFAFILGGVLGLVGFYSRLRVSETPIFESIIKSKQAKSPFFEVIQSAWQKMVLTLTIGALTSSIVYMVKAYINVYYTHTMHVDHAIALKYLLFASTVVMLTIPIAGALADSFGSKNVMLYSTVSCIIFIMPILYIMSSNSYLYQIFGIFLLSATAGMLAGCSYIYVISFFKPEQRFTGVAFSFNLGVAVFGGTTPIIASYLVELTSAHYSPGFYIIFLCALYLIFKYKYE